jgi:replicative DNA helicase
MINNIEKLIRQLEEEIKVAKKDVYDAEALLRLKEIAKEYKGDDRIVCSKDLVEEIKSRPEEFKMFSGIPKLDDILKGFRLNQLIVLAAPTKHGKTSFSMYLTKKLKEYNPLWFPFEQGADELIEISLERNQDPPEFYLPKKNTPYLTSWIEERIIEGIVKYNTRIIFIDHLHFIVPFTAHRYDLEVGKVMRELKSIAKRWNVCIVVIAHLKKTNNDTNPDMEDLRDSSFVAQEADTVMFIWRKTTKEGGETIISNEVNLSIQANRRTGKTGNIKMVYDYQTGDYVEKEWKDMKEIDEAFNLNYR